MAGKVRIDRVRTNGIFSLDGKDVEVENNIWLIGDDDEVLDDRRVLAVICTHGHNDHINAALDLHGFADRPPIALHSDDKKLWNRVYVARGPDMPLKDGQVFDVAGTRLEVIHTPGHSPGGVCLYWRDGGVVFSGDTLFRGGPGATGRSFSDFPTIIESIRDRLLTLPPETVVHTGHGESTTIGDEAPHLQEWIDRGH
jgi:glyoxylase-like metal-dependent hydrolase (beta-lactamase superfamily II)